MIVSFDVKNIEVNFQPLILQLFGAPELIQQRMEFFWPAVSDPVFGMRPLATAEFMDARALKISE
jgi:hypothetical protein